MARWTDAEIAALESDDAWDHEHGELVEPPADKPHGSVFAVRLNYEDARRIDYAAEQVGQTILEFMRQAALERAAQFPAPPPRTARRAQAEGA
ncbi:MAG TPA: hypothetical protein VII06_37830 [Chloroflexota bacterium]|jgi:hypothetical protein